jgi:hypothetical protein
MQNTYILLWFVNPKAVVLHTNIIFFFRFIQ